MQAEKEKSKFAQKQLPCIRLGSEKFELTNQDSAGGEN